MKRGQLHRVRVLRPHLEEDFFKGVELAAVGVDVVLVHLVDKSRLNTCPSEDGRCD